MERTTPLSCCILAIRFSVCKRGSTHKAARNSAIEEEQRGAAAAKERKGRCDAAWKAQDWLTDRCARLHGESDGLPVVVEAREVVHVPLQLVLRALLPRVRRRQNTQYTHDEDVRSQQTWRPYCNPIVNGHPAAQKHTQRGTKSQHAGVDVRTNATDRQTCCEASRLASAVCSLQALCPFLRKKSAAISKQQPTHHTAAATYQSPLQSQQNSCLTTQGQK